MVMLVRITVLMMMMLLMIKVTVIMILPMRGWCSTICGRSTLSSSRAIVSISVPFETFLTIDWEDVH